MSLSHQDLSKPYILKISLRYSSRSLGTSSFSISPASSRSWRVNPYPLLRQTILSRKIISSMPVAPATRHISTKFLRPLRRLRLLASARAKLKVVKEVYFIYGPYDAFLSIETDTSQEIQRIVLDEIRLIQGIKSTITCFIAD